MKSESNRRRLSRTLAVTLIALLTALLTACPRPLVMPMGPSEGMVDPVEQDYVSGRVDFGQRSVQANIVDDIGPGSTIALIEVATGNTVSTARTDSKGNFVLKYSNGFKPVKDVLYYFEALKGLDGGTGQPNMVGADVARVRTVASYRRGGWVTLTSGSVTNNILITPMSTALSVVVSVRSTTATPIDASTLFGAIKTGIPQGGYPDTVDIPNPALLSLNLVQETYTLVLDSLDKNRDPLRWIRLSSGNPNSVALPDVPFTIAYLSPDAQVAGENITLVGSNYDADPTKNKVFFQTTGGASVSATVVSVAPDLARLTVTVPSTAINGNVVLRIAEKTLTGPPFRLATRDGHSVVDPAGNVYVVNKALGSVAIIEPIPGASDKTSIHSLISGLTDPGALTFGPNFNRAGNPYDYKFLYVATAGATPKIFGYDITATPLVQEEFGGGVAEPSGMAFRTTTSALYLSDYTQNAIYVVQRGQAAQQVVISGEVLDKPRGLCFGPDGNLYVANSGRNNVLKITLSSATSGNAIEYAAGLSAPWGLAFDNRGSFYVSNNQGNSVFTIPVTSAPGVTPLVYGSLTSFASIPTPGGVDADSSGYLYVADNVTNGIYRINPDAESRQIGFGVSYPVATWADASGVYTLTEGGRLIKIDPQEKVSVYAEGLAGSRGLVRDGNGYFWTHQRNLNALTRISPDGSTAQMLTGLGSYYYSDPAIHNNKIYLRKNSSETTAQGQVDVFDLANLTGTPNETHRALMRRVISMAQDQTAAGAYRGYYYALQNSENNEQTILRVQRFSGSRSDTTKIILNEDDRLKMKNPVDLAVASDGRIWVADTVGSDGNGSLHIYNADGTYAQEITDIENPVRIKFDGTYVVTGAHVAAGYLRFYNANGTPAKTLTGLNRPAGMAFWGGSLYVQLYGDGDIYKFDNYAAIPNATDLSGSLAANLYVAYSNIEDIEIWNGYLMLTSGGSIRLLEADRVTFQDNWRSHYSSLLRMKRALDGQMMYVTNNSWLHLHGDGFYTCFTSGLNTGNGRGDDWYPNSTGVITNTSMVSYGRSGAQSILVDTRLDGTKQQTYKYGYDWGAIVSDGADTVYLATITNGTIHKWTNGTLSTLVSGGYAGGADHVLGLAYYNGLLYQPIREKHVIREVNAATATRRELKVGLVAPEL